MSDRGSTDSRVLRGFVRVGRYFQMVSIGPAAVTVVSLVLLVVAGAPAQSPDLHRLRVGLETFGLWHALLLGLVVVVVGMVTHPLQFLMIRFLEGYWGPSEWALHAMSTRGAIHFARRRELTRRAEASAEVIAELSHLGGDGTRGHWLVPDEQDVIGARYEYQEFTKAVAIYPRDAWRILPTRLGNVLRHYEDQAGSPYGLDAVAVVPHLLAVAGDSEVANVNDARTELDLAVRFVFAWLAVAVLSFLLLWPFGGWLVVPILAYVGAWISYAGAIQAAHDYGTTLQVLIDLNHQRLSEGIDSLSPPDPAYRVNVGLSRYLRRDP